PAEARPACARAGSLAARRKRSTRAGRAACAASSHRTAPAAGAPRSFVATPVTPTLGAGGGGATVDSCPQPGAAAATATRKALHAWRPARLHLHLVRLAGLVDQVGLQSEPDDDSTGASPLDKGRRARRRCATAAGTLARRDAGPRLGQLLERPLEA